MRPHTLFTIGYEGLDLVRFIERLQQEGVEAIVDVRELPLSRKKGFSKTALREALAANGMAYCHVPALGCPKNIRDAYRADGDWSRYTRGFMKHLDEQDACVRELAKFALRTTACLMCFEADFLACHRTYVARAAYRLGGPTLKHITARTAFVDELCRVAA